jgi:predicted nucleic acid-binding protein
VLLLDNSAWVRLLRQVVPKDRASVIAAWMDRGEIAVSLPFLLEAGYSARSAADRQALMASFASLPRVEVDREVERFALQAQRELAEIGHHRLAPMDVIIAACAHKAKAGVLHYDSDYDNLAAHTSLTFDSEWLVPAGTADSRHRDLTAAWSLLEFGRGGARSPGQSRPTHPP